MDHLFKTVDGVDVRKAEASGAGNDCVYLTPANLSAGFVHDSKAGVQLNGLSAGARRGLIALASGTLGILGILGILGSTTAQDSSSVASAACISASSTDAGCRAINW